MGEPAHIEIEVFSRPGCHLCEIMLEELLPLVRDQYPVVVRNIDENAEWKREFRLRIPVLHFNGKEVCHFHLDKEALIHEMRAETSINGAS
jgi:hypothetical protein